MTGLAPRRLAVAPDASGLSLRAKDGVKGTKVFKLTADLAPGKVAAFKLKAASNTWLCTASVTLPPKTPEMVKTKPTPSSGLVRR